MSDFLCNEQKEQISLFIYGQHIEKKCECTDPNSEKCNKCDDLVNSYYNAVGIFKKYVKYEEPKNEEITQMRNKIMDKIKNM